MKRIYKKILLGGALSLAGLTTQAQVKVGDNPTVLAPNTVFQVEKGGSSMVVSNSGWVGIGTATPLDKLEVLGGSIWSRNNGWAGLSTSVADVSRHPTIFQLRSRGTLTAPTYPQNGDILGAMIARDGVDGFSSPNYGGASMEMRATENFSAAAKGNRVLFMTTANGTTGAAERMTIDHNGRVGISTSTPRETISIGNDFHIHNGGWKGFFSNMSYVTLATGDIYQKTSSRRASSILLANAGVGGFPEGSIVFAVESGASPASIGSNISSSMPLAMYVDGTTGNVGIGIGGASQKLHVAGNILASGTITPSDRRFKQNIQPLGNALALVGRMRGVSYTHTEKAIDERKLAKGNQIGFIAQELETIYPEFVITSSDGYKAVDYARLTPVLVEAIKELSAKVEKLEGEKASVAANYNDLKAEVASIKAMLKTLPASQEASGK